MATCFLRPGYHLNIGDKAGGKGVRLFLELFMFIRIGSFRFIACIYTGVQNVVRDKSHDQAWSDSCYATQYFVKSCLKTTNGHQSKQRLFKLVWKTDLPWVWGTNRYKWGRKYICIGERLKIFARLDPGSHEQVLPLNLRTRVKRRDKNTTHDFIKDMEYS